MKLVANKFQTGFDQPKLCAMYVDKKLCGVECVQTLSRLNRTYPGKEESGTFVLDFFNDPQDILESFLPYYQTSELADVSDPDLVFDLFDKLRAADIFTWQEVEQFAVAFFAKNKSSAAISNICKPAVRRWQERYKKAIEAYKIAKDTFEYIKKSGDPVLTANAEKYFKECRQEKDRLEIFKKDLSSFTRFYELMSQIVAYDDKDLINYAHTIRDKVSENRIVMDQVRNNSPEQAMLGDFPKALDDAVMDSSEAHQKQMMQILSNPEVAKGFARVVFDLIRQAI